MKKSLLALAALTAFAGVASAQSSVTLFGIVDLNLRNQKNAGQDIKSLSDSGLATSRIGFRGVEDLGGGLRAGFWIEGALVPDTGTPGGQNWRRRSTVSLMGGFGEIRLGRDYTPTFWNHTVFDPFGTNGVGSQTNLIEQGAASGTSRATVLGSGAGTLVRADNTIGYFLPSGLGGLYGQVMVAAGEGVAGNKYQGGRVGYAAGPIDVAVAYGKTDLGATDLKAFNIGGAFNAGFAKFFGQYHKYDFGASDLKNYLIGAAVPFGAGTFKASYGRSDVDTGAVSREASQIAIGYVYDLSKRTALYAAYSQIDNDPGLTFITSTSGPAMIAGRKSTGYEFGVRHSF